MSGRLGERGADPALLDEQVVPGLEVHPELAGVAEIVRQAERRVGGDASPAQDDLVDAPRRHAEIHRDPVLADAERGEELLREDFAGVDGARDAHREQDRQDRRAGDGDVAIAARGGGSGKGLWSIACWCARRRRGERG